MSGLGDGQCPGESHGYNALVERVVHVPYTVEQDETGWWCAHAPLPGGGAGALVHTGVPECWAPPERICGLDVFVTPAYHPESLSLMGEP